MKRRTFARLAAALPVSIGVNQTASLGAASGVSVDARVATDDRAYWLQTLLKIADPVLSALAQNRLKATMPVESAPGQRASRVEVSHLEALGRTLAGLAPWLELGADDSPEGRSRQQYLTLTKQAIANGVNPQSADYLNFIKGGQPLVDSAFLAHGLVRSPKLWHSLSADEQANVVKALQASRVIKPGYSNWLLFTAMVEAALLKYTGSCDEVRMDYAIRQHQAWYKGDGAYGDGPDFHWDYYNSYVIQPMLLDVVKTLTDAGKA